MTYLILIYLIYTIYKISLSFLELNFVKSKMNDEPVVLERDEYKSAANVKITNEKFEIFSIFYSFVIAIFWIVFGLKSLQNLIYNAGFSEAISSSIFVISFLILGLLFSLPLEIYAKFIKDKRLGFSNTTPKIFITDTLKSLILTIVFGGTFIYILILFFNKFWQNWWIYGFLFSFFVVLLISLIYPTIIAPLFNKMSALEDGDLKESINSLLLKCGFKSSGVFVIDASKRDKRLNAYFGGFGATKRVVLFDTLIEKLSKEEILAVLAHELGHFKHGDILKNIALQFVIFAVVFGIFGNTHFYLAMNLDESAGSVIVFMILFMPILFAFLEPLVSKFSRMNEFGADNFSRETRNKEDMINALKKLGSQNKAFPISHPLYSAIYHSHPSLYERISELENH